MTARTRPCAWCREEMPWRAADCPRCGERQPEGEPRVGPREIAAWICVGSAVGLVTVAVALRAAVGPLPDLAAVAESLRFLEKTAVAALLLLLALVLRRP